MDFQKIFPINCKNKWNKIYFSYYNESLEKQYIEFDSFRHYFYFSDIQKPIIKMSDAKKFYSNNFKNDVQRFDNLYESDLQISRRFMIDTFGKQQSLEKTELRIGYLDIENLINGKINTEGKEPITAISIFDSKTDKNYTFVFDPRQEKIDKENKIRFFKNEDDMLKSFLEFMGKCKFDILTGWNLCKSDLGDGYDIPYLCNRLEKFGLLEKLSPFGIVERAYNDNNKFIIYGLDVVDYRAIYKHFKNLMGESISSASLESVSENELNQHKLDVGDDLNLLYRNDINKYVEYNRQDVWLVKELEKKLGYLNLIDEIRRIGLCNFEDSTSNSIVIDNIIIKTLNQKGYIVQSKQHNHKDSSYEGAYVAPTIPGIYNNVICYDFLSLYPFTIMNFNISPDSYIKKIKKEEIFLYDLKEDEILAANGAIFTKKVKGFIPQICEWLFSKRQEYKKKKSEAINEIEKNKYDLSQTAYKILLNSIYGFMGASFTRFYSNDLAEAITLSGQNIIKYSHSELKKLGCQIIAGDTDSCYITKEDLKTKEQTVEFAEQNSKYIDDKLKIYCNKNFGINLCTFHFQYEKSARKAVFFKKKNYILKIFHVDGKYLEKEKIVYKGVSVKKKDTSDYAKKYLKKLYNMITEDDVKMEELKQVMDEFRINIDKVPCEEIALPISVNKDIVKYDKTLPIHIRGVKVWEEKYASMYNKSFDNINKGFLYFIKNEIGKDNEGKDPVITIPEGSKMPPGIIIDYDRTRNRIVEMGLDNFLDILDIEEVKARYKNYLGYDSLKVKEILYEEIKSELLKLDYINKIDKVLFRNRLYKFIDEESIQNKLYVKYCEEKQIDKDDLSEYMIEKLKSRTVCKDFF